MHHFKKFMPKLLLLAPILFSHLSCSKDADLLSGYVINKTDDISGVYSLVVDDIYFSDMKSSILLDVLNNDTFENFNTVTVVGTSDPKFGTVVINENNTLTYTPPTLVENETVATTVETVEEVVDTFVYTVEETNEDGTVITEEGNVTVNANRVQDELNASVLEWKQKFDAEWARSKGYYTEQSTGPEVGNQRRYYDFRVIDGLIYMFQATGDIKYVNDFFWYVDRIKKEARPSTYHNDSYFDWEVPFEGDMVAFQLYDGHGLRNVFKMLWLLKKYPEVMAQANFQQKYDEYLPWFTKNLWDKWKSRGPNSIIRSNTHMASHMASNMALYLSLLEENTIKKNEYLSWVEAWNNDVQSKWPNYGGTNPGGFRDQLRLNDPHNGYVWAGPWGNKSSANDITHTNAEIQAVINQYNQGIEWNDNDIQLFLNTLNNTLDQAKKVDLSDIPFYIDLRTNSSSVKTLSYGWAMLGRFDETTQLHLKNFSISRNKASYYYNIYLGVMAFNRAYLDDTIVYPDF